MKEKVSIDTTIEDINKLSDNLKYLLIEKDKKKKYKKKLNKLQELINNPETIEEVITDDYL